MTKEILEQYPDLCAELRELRRAAAEAVSDTVSGSMDAYPFTRHPVKIRGVPPLPPEDAARIEQLERQKTAIEQFVCGLPNARLRRIAALRAMHGLSWRAVAAHMGHRQSESAVKMIYHRIFK